jgi:GLPGLI family protein
MKKIFVVIVILTAFIARVISQETLDTSYMECTYKFVFMRDTVEKIKTTRDTDMRLLVGNKYSKFYSHRLFSADSVFKSMGEDEKVSMLANGGLTDLVQKYGSSEAYKVYTNHKENRIIFTDMQPPNKILYREPICNQDWKILDETKEIAGYKCKNAKCSFRGRDYIAWFTNEIPVSEGPWKFNGLPGLIVKVYDIQEHYDFELIFIRKIGKEITFNENYLEVKIKDYIKICRNRIQNPLAYLMSAGRNVKTTFSPEPKQYDVMERDIK